MKQLSLIYKSIVLYRAIMNLLYLGKYKQRFYPIIDLIKGNNIIELCFGDIQIANYCKNKGIRWIGYDVNERFVNYAKNLGFDARLVDLKQPAALPKVDTCIIAGSLYHFHEDMEGIMLKMLNASNRIIISEPVINLSSSKGIIGFIARRSANVGGEKAQFRFNKCSFLDMLSTMSLKFSFEYKVVKEFDKDIIVVLTKFN